MTVAHSELSDLLCSEGSGDGFSHLPHTDGLPAPPAPLTPAALRGVHPCRVICSESPTATSLPCSAPLPAPLSAALSLPCWLSRRFLSPGWQTERWLLWDGRVPVIPCLQPSVTCLSYTARALEVTPRWICTPVPCPRLALGLGRLCAPGRSSVSARGTGTRCDPKLFLED